MLKCETERGRRIVREDRKGKRRLGRERKKEMEANLDPSVGS
jgi:hypothetical protein